ncbi:hypothetical protein [Reichenbachiella sp. MALMAid0571]|uniref:tetratricopeptide repeat protein n=1 Tax=Reichenbachiella sp. MALMAid0571 TaxID=3143939 RepID=UPI0032DE30A7
MNLIKKLSWVLILLLCAKYNFCFSQNENEMPSNEYIVYEEVDSLPTYIDGDMSDFYDYLYKKIKYTVGARFGCKMGRIYIHFIINQNGGLDSLYALNRMDSILTARSLKAIEMTSGKWNPGKVEGVTVNTRMILPITFQNPDCLKRYRKKFNMAIEYYVKNDFTKALTYFRSTYFMNPSDEILLTKMAECYLKINKPDSACYYLSNALFDENALKMQSRICK